MSTFKSKLFSVFTVSYTYINVNESKGSCGLPTVCQQFNLLQAQNSPLSKHKNPSRSNCEFKTLSNTRLNDRHKLTQLVHVLFR